MGVVGVAVATVGVAVGVAVGTVGVGVGVGVLVGTAGVGVRVLAGIVGVFVGVRVGTVGVAVGTVGVGVGVAITPVPLKVTVWGLPLALLATVKLPERKPSKVGLNVILMIQLLLALKVAGQLFVWAKSPPIVMALMLNVPRPVFCKVMGCALLVTPTV